MVPRALSLIKARPATSFKATSSAQTRRALLKSIMVLPGYSLPARTAIQLAALSPERATYYRAARTEGVTIIGDGNFVQGNFIGTDVSGTVALGNKLGGMLIVGSNNLVGGTAAGARNVISGNDIDGVQIATAGSSNNLIQGNFIGTDVSGTADLGNGRVGVLISAEATNNTVGGTSDAARNVISGNEDIGVQIANVGTNNNTVQGNFIGTDASGSSAIGNSIDGVEIDFGASGNTIGGSGFQCRQCHSLQRR